MTVRPRRSVLYMPGSNPRALEKARELPADVLILDLEDAVAPEAKLQAREAVVKAIQQGFGDREVLVRINGLDTALVGRGHRCRGRRRAPMPCWCRKFLRRASCRILPRAWSTWAPIRMCGVWAMMETPLAMLNVRDIAAAALDSETRLAGFVMGTNDLAKDTRARLVPGRAPMLPWLMNCLAAARAYGLDILDGVYNDIGDAAGFAAECRQARDLGFDGKTLIHPRQIEPCNEAFSPTAEEVDAARKIIAAFDLPENENKGVLQIEGRMVERLHAEMARRTVAIADAIAKRRQPA